MSDEQPSTEPNSGDHRFWSRHKWRGKFSRADGKVEQDQEIESFLHSPIAKKNASNAVAPRIDTSSASRWAREADSTPLTHVGKRRPPRKQSLHVNFVATAPEIIGEGGDEASLPPIEISSLRKNLSEKPVLGHEESSLELRATTVIGEGNSMVIGSPTVRRRSDEAIFKAHFLQRTPTGLKVRSQQSDTGIAHAAIEETDLAVPDLESSASSVNYAQANLPTISDNAAAGGQATLTKEDNSSCQDDLPVFPNTGRSTQAFSGHDNIQTSTPKLALSDLKSSAAYMSSLNPLPSPQPSLVTSEDSTPNLLELETTEPRLSYSHATRAKRETDGKYGYDQELAELNVEPQALPLGDFAKDPGDVALHEFATNTQHFYSVFRLNMSNISELSFQQLMRMASWWFLKGKTEFETFVRDRPVTLNEADDKHVLGSYTNPNQAYMDLAKCCWICTEIVPTHPVLKQFGNTSLQSLRTKVKHHSKARLASLIDFCLTIIAHMKVLALSMKRNKRLPPEHFEMQGLDSSILLRYPRLAPSLLNSLSCGKSTSMVEEPSYSVSLLQASICDTDIQFNYGHMFVEATVDDLNGNGKQINIPCILSITRQKTIWDLTIIVSSQDEQIDVMIRPDRSPGSLNWKDVRWKIHLHALQISLSRTSYLELNFTKENFKTLWGIHNYIQTVQTQYQCRKSELQCLQYTLKSFQYFAPRGEPSKFPTKPVSGCHLRLFESKISRTEGIDKNKEHGGHRIIVVTPPEIKSLSSVSQELGKQSPILFSYLRSEKGGPALLLKSSKNSRAPSMVLAFEEEAEREYMYALISSTHPGAEEICSNELSLKSFTVADAVNSNDAQSLTTGFLSTLRWQHLRIIKSEPTHPVQSNTAIKPIQGFRTWIETPGEMQISISTDSLEEIKLIRHPQTNLTMTFADSEITKEQSVRLQQEMDLMNKSQTVAIYNFQSIADMHTFQTLITSLSVIFDGFATSYSISRRRMVVPIHKRWEANMARLQLLKNMKTTQLVAFFKDFPYGSCMNFILKSTDKFESFSHSRQYCIRIVDAKFALPKSTSDPWRDFICLDLPDYPSEHDDVTITFGSEAGTISFIFKMLQQS
ncbi:MAG: hypothetical protein Q9167_000201 [Letrouitia subvulpina]